MSTPYRNIARVVKAQGRKGEVVVAALRGLPFCLHEGMEVALTPPALERERFSRVLSCAADEGAGSARVLFSCCSDIAGAEGIVGCTVLAKRADLDLGSLDVAFDEIVGRAVVTDEGLELGVVKEAFQTPANDVWVVETEEGDEVMLPVIPDVVLGVPGVGAIRVHLLEGLI